MFSAVLVIDRDGRLPCAKICGFGVIAMLAHSLVFTVAIRALSDAWHMLMTIASCLFFVETTVTTVVILMQVYPDGHDSRTSPPLVGRTAASSA